MRSAHVREPASGGFYGDASCNDSFGKRRRATQLARDVFTTLDLHPDFDAGLLEHYADAQQQAVLADELGFDGY